MTDDRMSTPSPDASGPPLAAAPARRTPSRRRGGIGGWILILLGAFFLANNLGLLEWLEWSLAWPALLIIIGIAMILRRSGG
jgi:hypothetical protein